MNKENKIELGRLTNPEFISESDIIIKHAVCIYNNLRTHFSLDLRKPAEVHLNSIIGYKS